MKILITHIVEALESLAHPSLQESYDNVGTLVGDINKECTGVICTLDVTEAVLEESIKKKANLIISHHPIIFNGLKRLNGNHYVERIVITAIKHDIVLYAIHTNLDNVLHGVNTELADILGLVDRTVLLPKSNTLKKLYTFAPSTHVENIKQALFTAGAGHIGFYSECSFQAQGIGTFKASLDAQPFIGKAGERHEEAEIKIETVFSTELEPIIIQALLNAHPYETVAYDIVSLSNAHPERGSGILGQLPEPLTEQEWLRHVQTALQLKAIRHTTVTGKKMQKIAICGGAGSFLTKKAIQANADSYITADIKYHEFFEADGKLLLMDVGHWESEQFTINLLQNFLRQKFPTFAILKSEIITNPIQHYF